MGEKKNKWYLPDEFKSEYWKGRGATQIGIGIVITICGIFYQQNAFFIIGGIAWTIFGIVLIALDNNDEQKGEQQSYKTQRDSDDTDTENDEELKALQEESRRIAEKINKLEQKTKKKGS